LLLDPPKKKKGSPVQGVTLSVEKLPVGKRPVGGHSRKKTRVKGLGDKWKKGGWEKPLSIQKKKKKETCSYQGVLYMQPNTVGTVKKILAPKKKRKI